MLPLTEYNFLAPSNVNFDFHVFFNVLFCARHLEISKILKWTLPVAHLLFENLLVGLESLFQCLGRCFLQTINSDGSRQIFSKSVFMVAFSDSKGCLLDKQAKRFQHSS